MNNVIIFGIITGSAIMLALVSDLFLAPALMKMLYGKKDNHGRSPIIDSGRE